MVDGLTPPLSPPAAGVGIGRRHKRVRWSKPTKGKKRPSVIDTTRAELVRALEERKGALWWRVARVALVAGYAIDKASRRDRTLRRDGAESLLAMIVALIYCSDIRTGFVGRHNPAGGRWLRYKVRDLCQFASGAQGEAELRRGRRSLDVIIGLGWMMPTAQVRRHQPDGSYKSEPGVRHLNWSRLTQMCGTSELLRRDRAHKDQHDHTTRPPRLKKQGGVQSAAASIGQHAERGTRRALPAATGDPPPKRAGGATTAAEEIAKIAALLKLT